jgi:pimeloyl-ACP methyl ester carboxylesterase
LSSTAARLHEFTALGPHGFTHVAYAEWGPVAAAQTVICVHGLTRNGRDFDFLAQRLARRGVRVVAPDLPGRGRSDFLEHAEDYGTPLYVAVMAGLISRLGVLDVDWIGTSLGGHIGMELASRPGTPIRRLVLNDFGAMVPAAALQRIGNYIRIDRMFQTVAEVEAYLREIYAPFGDLTDAQWRHMARYAAAGEKGNFRLHYDPAIVQQFRRPLLLDVTLWRVWEHVACDVLILRGQHSDLLLPGTVTAMQRRGIAAAQGKVQAVEIPGCGHAPSLMAEDQIRLIENYLVPEPVPVRAARRASLRADAP